MSLETIPGTPLTYHLIAYDADGNERLEPGSKFASSEVLAALKSEPVTDVFMISHGWMGDVAAARDQYNRWIGAVAACGDDLAAMKAKHPDFHPLLIGLHWPSLPFGDESLTGGAASFAAGPGGIAPPSVEAQVEEYAGKIADTPKAREALRKIFQFARDNVAPDELPPDIVEAYNVLDRESQMGSTGPGGKPGDDRDPFDPEAVFDAVNGEDDDQVNFGLFDLKTLLSPVTAPVQTLSYWKMKERARVFGESGGATLLRGIQTNAPKARVHLMGHSFGCVVMSATLAGPGGNGPLVRPVDSLALVQGALSLWSYCSAIPSLPGQAGYFRSIVQDHRVKGPIITTQSRFDTAVGTWYPLASGVARQVTFGLPDTEYPKYGGVGTHGLHGPGPKITDLKMVPASVAYSFEPGGVYNIESSQFIAKSLSKSSGAHSDIAHPEVAHAVWTAARGS